MLVEDFACLLWRYVEVPQAWCSPSLLGNASQKNLSCACTSLKIANHRKKLKITSFALYGVHHIVSNMFRRIILHFFFSSRIWIISRKGNAQQPLLYSRQTKIFETFDKNDQLTIHLVPTSHSWDKEPTLMSLFFTVIDLWWYYHWMRY